jgi:hypothetical protein
MNYECINVHYVHYGHSYMYIPQNAIRKDTACHLEVKIYILFVLFLHPICVFGEILTKHKNQERLKRTVTQNTLVSAEGGRAGYTMNNTPSWNLPPSKPYKPSILYKPLMSAQVGSGGDDCN